mgnify:CR=1 FL=1
MNVQEIVNNRYGKGIAQCSNEEIYYALLEMTKSMAKEKESNEGKRKLYYISAEFLIGKLLSNNLINLGIYEEVKQVLAENGKNLAEIEEVEPEPSLGNGGLLLVFRVKVNEKTRQTIITTNPATVQTTIFLTISLLASSVSSSNFIAISTTLFKAGVQLLRIASVAFSSFPFFISSIIISF